jgi:hypothetical protein
VRGGPAAQRRDVLSGGDVQAAAGVALAGGVMGVATQAPQMFTSDPAVMASMVAVAPQLAVIVLFYTCVCALDGLTFAAGDMVYAASVQVPTYPIPSRPVEVSSLLQKQEKARKGPIGEWQEGGVS